MGIQRQLLKVRADLAGIALLTASLFACGGAPQKQDRRTYGADDISVDPRRVHDNSGDAHAANPQPAPGSGAGGDGTQDTGNGGQGGQTTPGDQPAGGDPGTPSQTPAVSVVRAGVRNFQQVNATMAALTGVPATTTTVKTAFDTQLTSSLPTDTDIQAFVGSNQVAVYKLAVEYCDALIKDPTKRATIFGNFDFTATPAVAFSDAGKKQVAGALIDNFWGTNLASLPPRDDSVGVVTQLIDDIMTGKSATTAALTGAVVEAVCTAVLASAPVTFF